MNQEQTIYLTIGEALCEIFGAHYSDDEQYQLMMEGCFTQDGQLMAKGLERLVSVHSGQVPLFLRGRIFQLTSSLKRDNLKKALYYAEKAKGYAGSLGTGSFSAA